MENYQDFYSTQAVYGYNPNVNQGFYGTNPTVNQGFYGTNPNANQANFGTNPNVNQPNFGSNPTVNQPNFGSNAEQTQTKSASNTIKGFMDYLQSGKFKEDVNINAQRYNVSPKRLADTFLELLVRNKEVMNTINLALAWLSGGHTYTECQVAVRTCFPYRSDQGAFTCTTWSTDDDVLSFHDFDFGFIASLSATLA